MKLRYLFLILFFCLLPATASAVGSLSTRVINTGGSILVNGTYTYTNLNGTVLKNYTTDSVVPIVVTANSGYYISNITINGLAQTIPPASSSPTQLNYSITITTAAQSFSCGFSAITVPVTMTVNDGGGYTNYTEGQAQNWNAGSVHNIVFTPQSGNQLLAIQGLPASGYTINPSLPAAINANVTLSLTVPMVPTPLTINGCFLGVVANAGTNQVVPTGSVATLDGSGSYIQYGGGTLTYNWVQTGGPAVTLSNPTATKPVFATSAATIGTLNFQLTVSNGSYSRTSTTNITVANSAASVARNMCQGCHAASGVGAVDAAFSNWSSGPHKVHFVMCQTCHIGADTGAHPGKLLGSTQGGGSIVVNETNYILNYPVVAGTTVNFCFQCHNNANELHYNVRDQLANLCSGCHVPNMIHTITINPSLSLGQRHFNGYTSSVNPNFQASYFTKTSSCSNCHVAYSTSPFVPYTAVDNGLRQKRVDWSGSKHGNLPIATANDYKSLNGCVRCHTSKGFIAYSTGKVTTAWGSPADITRGVLSCNTCHSNFSSGQLRSVAHVTPYPNDSAVMPVAGKSDICISCHSGTASGKTVKAIADFTNASFVDPHSAAAAGILNGNIGYHFTGQSYQDLSHFKHKSIGIGNFTAYGFPSGSDGPCITCHMVTSNQHSFLPFSEDGNGGVISIDNTSCASCHTAPAQVTPDRITSRRTWWNSTMTVFQKVLESRGIYYSDISPYFFKSSGNTSSGNAVTNWGSADTMGAAFNFRLLKKEPGAYAHNSIYAKRLIYDSIDFLDDGVLNNSVTDTINAVAGVDATTKALAVKWLCYSGSRP